MTDARPQQVTVLTVEEDGHTYLVVTELPPSVDRDDFVEAFIAKFKAGLVPELRDFTDFSTQEDGLRLQFEVKPGASVEALRGTLLESAR